MNVVPSQMSREQCGQVSVKLMCAFRMFFARLYDFKGGVSVIVAFGFPFLMFFSGGVECLVVVSKSENPSNSSLLGELLSSLLSCVRIFGLVRLFMLEESCDSVRYPSFSVLLMSTLIWVESSAVFVDRLPLSLGDGGAAKCSLFVDMFGGTKIGLLTGFLALFFMRLFL